MTLKVKFVAILLIAGSTPVLISTILDLLLQESSLEGYRLPVLLVLSALSLSIAGLFLSQVFLKPLLRATEITQAIAQGNLEDEFEAHRQDEIGVLLSSLQNMRNYLRETMQNQAELDEARSIAQALEHTSACVMLLNPKGEISYINHAASRMFRAAARDIQKELGWL